MHQTRYPNLYEVRLIPTKKDIAFVEFVDEGSATVAKDALHNYKLDGENKIKVRLIALPAFNGAIWTDSFAPDYFRQEVARTSTLIPGFSPRDCYCHSVLRCTINLTRPGALYTNDFETCSQKVPRVHQLLGYEALFREPRFLLHPVPKYSVW